MPIPSVARYRPAEPIPATATKAINNLLNIINSTECEYESSELQFRCHQVYRVTGVHPCKHRVLPRYHGQILAPHRMVHTNTLQSDIPPRGERPPAVRSPVIVTWHHKRQHVPRGRGQLQFRQHFAEVMRNRIVGCDHPLLAGAMRPLAWMIRCIRRLQFLVRTARKTGPIRALEMVCDVRCDQRGKLGNTNGMGTPTQPGASGVHHRHENRQACAQIRNPAG